jgi:hypothetical protein
MLSLGIPALIAVAGWFLGHWLNAKRELNSKRREIRLKGLETAYCRLAMASNRDWTDEHKLEFEKFVAEIQLYGTPRQIQPMIEIVQAFIRREPSITFDPLLKDLRDSLRQELRMEPVEVSVWWYRFTLPEWHKKQTPNPAVKADAPNDSAPLT